MRRLCRPRLPSAELASRARVLVNNRLVGLPAPGRSATVPVVRCLLLQGGRGREE